MAIQDPRDRLATFGQGIAALTPMGAGQVKVSPAQHSRSSRDLVL